MKNLLPWLASVLLFCAQPAWAGPDGPAEIRTMIETFMKTQTASLPGKVHIRVNEPDARVVPLACPKLEAFLPPGSQLIGNSTVGVRCPGDRKSRTLFVPVRVTVNTMLVVSGKPLQAGQVLKLEDLASRDGEMTATGMLTSPEQAAGKILRISIGPGQVLRQAMLRTPWIVTQGQTVQLRAAGDGFSIHSTGQALNNAAEGESVRVKTPTGRVTSGTAQADGSVNVRP